MIHSVGLYRDAVQLAMDKNNKEIIEVIIKETTKPSVTRAKETQSMMRTVSTGTYNYRSLGVQNIRKLCQSRGSREGNNALLKVSQGHMQIEDRTLRLVRCLIIFIVLML